MDVADELREIFDHMPDAFQSQKAGNINATIQLELSGDGASNWVLKVADGTLAVDESQVDSPDLTLKMKASDYIALTRGEANPMGLFMAGKIKLSGDMGLAMKFQEMFDMG